MQIGPETIDIDDVPRARVGGLRADVVEDLFRRVQWNYAQLEFDHRKLKEAVEQQSLPQFDQPGDPQSEVATTLELAEGGPVDQPSRSEEPQSDVAPRVEQAEGRLVDQRSRTEPDKLARLFLAAALQAAREARESARRDAELMLKKARARADELNREFEQARVLREGKLREREREFEHSRVLREAELREREREFEHSRVLREAELAELDAGMREIRVRMRLALRSIVSLAAVAEPTNSSKLNPSSGPEVGLPLQGLLAGNGNSAA